ncbi:MAG: CHASE4 domain-containing protein [Candidatus Margulisiibacteriota bacterium]
MTLRRKVMLIVSLGLLVSIALIFLATHYFLLTNALRNERQAVILDVKRAEIAINGRLNELIRITADYSHWDDTYQYISDRNEKYIKNNMTDSTFTNLKVSLFVLLDRDQRIVFAKCFDLDKAEAVPVPSDLAAHLRPGHPIMDLPDPQGANKGVLLLKTGPLLLAAVPILTSELKGPANGTLIVGRFLDKALLLQFINQIQVNMHLLPVREDSLAALEGGALKQLQLGQYQIRPQSGNLVAGYSLYPDLHGKPALLIQVDAPRDIYRQGQQTIIAFAVMIMVIGLLIIVFSLLILERIILAPLATLSGEVVKISRRGDPTTRLKASGNDELAVLARQINEALDAVNLAEKKQGESENKFEKLFASIPEAIYLEKLDGTIVDCNPAAAQMTGYAREELLHLKSYDLVPPEVARGFPRLVEQTLVSGSFFVEGANKRKNGEIFPVEVGTKLLELGGEKMVLVMIRDISEQKQTAEKMRQQIKELEDFQHTVVGRELKMIELEKEIDTLRVELGRLPKYQ